VINNVPVRFTGFLNQTEIVRAYVASDALVMTSESETWGLVANEAMTCGIPCVVSSGVGCGPDLVLAGRTGSIFPMGDVNTLGAIFLDLAQDRTRLRIMGNNAKERTRQFSIESALDGLTRAIAAVHG
jgi:glycosyltransferase involved in cell wall biosynthesis